MRRVGPVPIVWGWSDLVEHSIEEAEIYFRLHIRREVVRSGRAATVTWTSILLHLIREGS